MTEKRFPFLGQCVNGPWQGQTHGSYNSSFTIAFCPPPGPADREEDFSGAVETIKYGTYRWSHGRGVWFWEPPR